MQTIDSDALVRRFDSLFPGRLTYLTEWTNDRYAGDLGKGIVGWLVARSKYRSAFSLEEDSTVTLPHFIGTRFNVLSLARELDEFPSLKHLSLEELEREWADTVAKATSALKGTPL